MLRAGMTDAEECLWMRIRGHQLDGLRFRRQMPIGNYIVDFACKSARLIIEVDGGHHGLARESDLKRTAELQSIGYRVLRFWNNDVLQQTDSVIDAIRMAVQSDLLSSGPHPDPPPGTGEGVGKSTASSASLDAGSRSQAASRRR
jgi:very-short-patch-repair endonuclease